METERPEAATAVPARRFGFGALVLAALVGAAVAGGAVAALTGSAAPVADTPVSKYQCPMHPAVIQDHPGNCPICGMKLVAVRPGQREAEAAPQASGHAEAAHSPPLAGLAAVELDPERQQLIGLKTTEVTRGPMGGAWRSVGRVAIDETRVRHVNLKVSGFVEQIFVDFVGKPVKRGDPLFSLYSPDLLATQDEYLLALRSVPAGSSAEDNVLVAAARRKLELWDVPKAELDRLTRTRQATKSLMFHSPLSGVVTKKDVVQGMKLEAGAMPYEIVDLSRVWVLVDVYESELRHVVVGMEARLHLNAFPNREFVGKVMFIDPLLDPRSRTVKVRLTFPNPTGELRPEMFGEAVLMATPHDALVVPLDAVLDSGTQKIAFVATSPGKFEPRRVTIGDSDGERVEILSGLERGERVVTRANFLVDSESRLRASLSEGAPPPPAPESARVLPATPSPPPPAPSPHSGHGAP